MATTIFDKPLDKELAASNQAIANNAQAIANINTRINQSGITKLGSTKSSNQTVTLSFTASYYDMIIVTNGWSGYTATSVVLPLKNNNSVPISGSKGTITDGKFYCNNQNGNNATSITLECTNSTSNMSAFGVKL